jgi:hypothetical protein
MAGILNKTIESASASFILTLSDLFGLPLKIQGFAPEDMFDTDAVKPTDVVMGVDGVLSGGMVYKEVVQKVHLSPDSPSIAIFDAWYTTQQQSRKAYAGSAVIRLPGIGMSYICTTGWLTNYTPIAAAKKHLQPQEFEITWQGVQPLPIS